MRSSARLRHWSTTPSPDKGLVPGRRRILGSLPAVAPMRCLALRCVPADLHCQGGERGTQRIRRCTQSRSRDLAEGLGRTRPGQVPARVGVYPATRRQPHFRKPVRTATSALNRSLSGSSSARSARCGGERLACTSGRNPTHLALEIIWSSVSALQDLLPTLGYRARGPALPGRTQRLEELAVAGRPATRCSARRGKGKTLSESGFCDILSEKSLQPASDRVYSGYYHRVRVPGSIHLGRSGQRILFRSARRPGPVVPLLGRVLLSRGTRPNLLSRVANGRHAGLWKPLGGSRARGEESSPSG